MDVKLNRQRLLDKIHGCWLGKNIGGTMGGPFESCKDLLDIPGFTTQKGEPLPNDDLDLQLVWLKALENAGAKGLNANILADYWLSYITPYWNEYGIAKSNLSLGLLPPLSGEYDNFWKNSNGAWIRSEIWACLTPGFPGLASKYAIMDASVDHGLSEGTYAEVFTATAQSIAFFEDNIRTIIEKALEFIPGDCRVAKSVRIVLDSYDNGLPWQQTRNLVVEDSADLGWFQAPGNIAFCVIGLLYGEGDFKQSLIYAINCGDDTDCTAGTCGALLGIICGAQGIPDELKEYVGDSIKTLCINGSYSWQIPKSCTELTERVMYQIPIVLSAHAVGMEWTDAKDEIDLNESMRCDTSAVEQIFARSPYCFEVPSLSHTSALIEYDRLPKLKPLGELNITVTLKNHREDVRYYTPELILPEGWQGEYDHTFRTMYENAFLGQKPTTVWTMRLTAGETVKDVNKIHLLFHSGGHAVPVYIPIVILG